MRSRFHTSDEPDDDDDTYRLNGLHRLIQFYNIPSSFLSERVQGVAHSFGVRESLDHRYGKATAPFNR